MGAEAVQASLRVLQCFCSGSIQQSTAVLPVLQVWPGKTVYPDYLDNPSTSTWLENQLTHMHSQVPFDGLWLDMNEASNFCSGMQCKPDKKNKTAMYWLEAETPKTYNITGNSLAGRQDTKQIDPNIAQCETAQSHVPSKTVAIF